jgi:hypothetical protein
MEPFDTKIDRFGGQNLSQRQLSVSLSWNPVTPLFSTQKRLKKRKIKFNTKISFLKNYKNRLPCSLKRQGLK